MELFDYQVTFLNNIYQELQNHKRVCAVAPTGAGKTVVMAQMCKNAVKFNQRLMIVVHLDVLVPQTLDKLKHAGINADVVGCIKAGYPENRTALIQVASIQTLARRHWWKQLDCAGILMDEAHQTTFHQTAKKHILTQDCKIIGFTATPRRLSKREGLQTYYESSVLAATHSELQEKHRLAKMRYFVFSGADLTQVRTRAGDYAQDDLRVACDHPDLINDIVKQWHKLVPGKRTIAFCVSIEHARHVAKVFRESGVSADVVTGDTPIKERNRLYADLASGKLTVLTSVNVISIGFDCPSVEVGLGLTPTKSWAKYIQMIGRVMRVADGKERGIWLDQSGNCLRFGLPEDLLEDDYEMDAATKGKSTGEAPVKECPQCGCLNHAAMKCCVECGYVFPLKDPLVTEGDYRELNGGITFDDPNARRYRKLLKQAFQKEYSPGWAYYRYKLHFERKHQTIPRKQADWRAYSVFDTFMPEYAVIYYNYLECVAEKSETRDVLWISAQFKQEFPTPEASRWLVQRAFDAIPEFVS